MRVVLDKAPEQGSEVADFINELKKDHPCLHFKPIPAAPARRGHAAAGGAAEAAAESGSHLPGGVAVRPDAGQRR